jgi:DNA polymerase-3 subunit delta'
MFTLLKVAAGMTPFGAWVPYSEAIGRSKSEKLELHLKVLYDLLHDVLVLRESGGVVRNHDLRAELETVAHKVSFEWIRSAVKRVDELARLIRRNIQKSIALDALILDLRS